ncbi:MerR family transcriptional regulator [Actinophytocola sp. NPDC049390]|uniref:MerR family transcriptional regulator n=1 Tax=Actinophytocola sp. NPDC049390 TaxID=3363894 RepID=UPI0037A67245
MRIGELAERAGVSVRALRYYEENHLLTAERSPSGQRHYRESAVDRVRWIQMLYAAGLPSKTIVKLLPCFENNEVHDGVLELLSTERARIDRQVHDLVETRDRLDEAIASATAFRDGVPCPVR